MVPAVLVVPTLNFDKLSKITGMQLDDTSIFMITTDPKEFFIMSPKLR